MDRKNIELFDLIEEGTDNKNNNFRITVDYEKAEKTCDLINSQRSKTSVIRKLTETFLNIINEENTSNRNKQLKELESFITEIHKNKKTTVNNKINSLNSKDNSNENKQNSDTESSKVSDTPKQSQTHMAVYDDDEL